MVLAFYRGSWCPYCNLELKFLQDQLSLLKDKNTTLVAVSPQSTDHSLAMVEKNKFEFEVLTMWIIISLKSWGLCFSFRILYFLIIRI
ncbi:redoxin domain-containing protein [Chryseobacterium sp. WG14]|nr:redoxin domain-containing protein [Chryseobacterium sp. WG14]MCQ9640199.1 redoxin domain-containing protein [Chryseobacterium sp. WG14]